MILPHHETKIKANAKPLTYTEKLSPHETYSFISETLLTHN